MGKVGKNVGAKKCFGLKSAEKMQKHSAFQRTSRSILHRAIRSERFICKKFKTFFSQIAPGCISVQIKMPEVPAEIEQRVFYNLQKKKKWKNLRKLLDYTLNVTNNYMQLFEVLQVSEAT